MALKREKKETRQGRYHEGIQSKAQKRISKENAQTQKREQLIQEYRSERKANAFVDKRKPDSALLAVRKSSKAARFILDDAAGFGMTDSLGLPSTDLLDQPQSNVSGIKSKQDYLNKFKQAKTEHRFQVQLDNELLSKLNTDFRVAEKTVDFTKLTIPKPQKQVDDEDEDFNKYLTLFSFPTPSTQKKKTADIDEKGIRIPQKTSRVCEEVAKNTEESEEMAEIHSASDTASVHPIEETMHDSSADDDAIHADQKTTDSRDSGPSASREHVLESLPMVCTSEEELNAYVQEYLSEMPRCTLEHKHQKQQVLFLQLIKTFEKEAELNRGLFLLECLASHVTKLGQQIPEHAQSMAKDKIMSLDLAFTLRLERKRRMYPTVSEFLLLKLLLCMFPLRQDFHPISHSIAFLLCRYLSEGTYQKRTPIVTGLHIASLLDTHLEKRFCPETLCFYRRLLTSDRLGGAFSNTPIHQMEPFSVEELLRGPSKTSFRERALKLCVLAAHRLSQKYQKAACFPEIFAPVVLSLENLARTMPDCELKQICLKECLALKSSIVDRAVNREPMKQFRKKSIGIVQNNPLFEENLQLEDFKKWREEQMTDRRVMKRKLTKERRAAMKELRKDGQTLSRVREEDKTQVDRQRLENENAFYKELNRFEADMRQGGQSDMNPHLKKKTRLWKY